jgi:hypothetical protein
VLGIYVALHRIFLDGARADQWLTRSNEAPLFGGKSPMARLNHGRVADLVEVRHHLEAVAEAGF